MCDVQRKALDACFPLRRVLLEGGTASLHGHQKGEGSSNNNGADTPDGQLCLAPGWVLPEAWEEGTS